MISRTTISLFGLFVRLNIAPIALLSIAVFATWVKTEPLINSMPSGGLSSSDRSGMSLPFSSGRPAQAGLQASLSLSADTLPCYDIQELALKHNGKYKNPFQEVDLEASFTSPSGVKQVVPGFYDSEDQWKVRFRPDEAGNWTFTYLMQGSGGFHQEGQGIFTCTPDDAQGRVRQHPENPYRWVFENGEAYFPVGLQSCVKTEGSQLRGGMIDGEKRDDGKARQVSMDEYFRIYGEAGFNLFRFSQSNCSYRLANRSLKNYHLDEILATDKLLSLARQHGFRVMYGFFGFYNRPSAALNGELIENEKRFLRYSVARWGVYVDFWELLNESQEPDNWITTMANYVREIDPDNKPISISMPKPELQAINITAPHWYESESELKSDQRVEIKAEEWKRFGKPVIFGEQGNQGMNWDPLSGQRMRIRTWTALFQEVSFVFWNTSWSKWGMFGGKYTRGRVANIYLGPEERGYIRVLQDFSSRLDADVRMAPVKISSTGEVRAYGFLSARHAAVYLHHFTDHTSMVKGESVKIQLPKQIAEGKKAVGEWIDPATGATLARVPVTASTTRLVVPDFNIDIALIVAVEN
jgi:hypothetical protein